MTVELKLHLLIRFTKEFLGEIPQLKFRSSKACPDAIPKVSITEIYRIAINSNPVPDGPNPRHGKVGVARRTYGQQPHVPRPRTECSPCPGAEPLYKRPSAQCFSTARSAPDSP